jgi:hypothetical protein
MVEPLLHLLHLAYGVGACVACFALFSLCGAALLPRRPAGQDGGSEDAAPAVLGAALFATVCWFGIKYGFRLNTAIGVWAGVAVVLTGLRWRHVRAEMAARALLSRRAAGWLLAFAAAYAASYVFLLPSVTGEYLPLSTLLNEDVYWYLTHTRYLQELGRSNVFGFSFLDYVYYQTPAVFYVIGLLSAFFRFDPLSASMPVLFACAGMMGVFAAAIAHKVFHLPRTAGVALGVILVSGSFFRYITGSYFLSSLMAVPVFLHLVWITVNDYRQKPAFDARMAVVFLSHDVLLLLLYPVFFFGAIAAQMAVFAVRAAAEGFAAEGWGVALRRVPGSAARMLIAMTIGAAVLVAIFQSHFFWAYRMAVYLSKPGVAGWALDVISPFAILGFPGLAGRYVPATPDTRALQLFVFGFVAVALVGLYFFRFRDRTSVLERTLAGIGAGTLAAYVLYFLQQGPSYQQWKFASYFPMPWSFVVWAAAARLAMLSDRGRRVLASVHGARNVGIAIVLVAALLSGGNMYLHFTREGPPLRFPGALARLSTLDEMPWIRELDVQMDQGGPTMLAAYFIRTKTLHMVSLSYYPPTPVSLQRVSRLRPYLVQNLSCFGAGHDKTMTIEGVGCLILEPPSIRLNTVYAFDRMYLPIDLDGLGPREEGGRWNTKTTVRVTVTADEKFVPLDQPAYLNLHMAPYVPPGHAGQRLVLSWGNGRTATATLDRGGWVSLPVERRDWASEPRLSTLTVSMDLPDAARRGVDPTLKDGRPLAVFMAHVSLTAAPAGRDVTPPPPVPGKRR